MPTKKAKQIMLQCRSFLNLIRALYDRVNRDLCHALQIVNVSRQQETRPFLINRFYIFELTR